MKRKIFIIAVIVICTAVLTSGTIAYFTSEDVAHNVITTGKIGIEVVEKTVNAENVLVDFPTDGVKNVMPGQSVSKIVWVKNSGTAAAWIRVEVEIDIIAENGTKLPAKLSDGTAVAAFSVLGGWIDGGDGFYYYENPVSAGGVTTELFKEVTFSLSMGNEYQNSAADVVVYAQAVQSANNPVPDGGDVTDVKGWPMKTSGEGDE